MFAPALLMTGDEDGGAARRGHRFGKRSGTVKG
jgi:hypothetical protein